MEEEQQQRPNPRMWLAIAICILIISVWQYFFAPKPVEQPMAVDNTTVVDSVASGAENGTLSAATLATSLSEPLIINLDKSSFGFDANTGDVRFVAMDEYAMEGLAPTFTDPEHMKNYATFSVGEIAGYTHTVENLANGVKVTFTTTTEQVEVTKSYELSNDSAYVPMSLVVRNISSSNLSIPFTATVESQLGDGFENGKYVFTGSMLSTGKDLEKSAIAKKLKNTITMENPLWGGVTSKYFLFAIFSSGFPEGSIVSTGEEKDDKVVQFAKIVDIAPGETASIDDLAIYAGPKDYNSLKGYNIGLQKSVDYGMFFFLAIPMKIVLQKAYSYVGNYGVAIILLTILVKIITLPLTMKSMLSMRKMSDLAPEVKKIREMYKDEPQKLNAATMDLYKRHKANPLSGCFPMLLQLPIFLALYRTLLVSIELKGAPFIFWVTDLSVKDPYYITPLLMGATMFLQQKLTPNTAADPMQQKIFTFMPVIFTFLFINFPAGLVVYWLTNNVLSIVQQLFINKRMN